MLEAVLRTAYGRPARTSERAFWRRYGRIEHERLEFKASARNLGESVVAMAMTLGGTILVGVGEDGSVQGAGPIRTRWIAWRRWRTRSRST